MRNRDSCFSCGRFASDNTVTPIPTACDECLCEDGRNLWKPLADWHLDLFSTFLSRKHSAHMRKGKLMFVKTIYVY